MELKIVCKGLKGKHGKHWMVYRVKLGGASRSGLPDKESAKEIARKLLAWFAVHRRPLPWRAAYDPYAIWIAEVMLQQTQVNTMLPYYHRWMERFPDTASVTRAHSDELLKCWEGMGYYQRVRHIQQTARIVMREYGGALPDDYQELLRLPGIGRYTAGAIASLAFNREYPAVDGNVERIFARLFDLESSVKESPNRSLIWTVAKTLIPAGRARDFNQALMELGALVCVRKKPRCHECPLYLLCRAYQLETVDRRPVTTRKTIITALEAALGILIEDGRVFIQKRPNSGLMAGLWEFPGGKLRAGEAPEEALRRELMEELGIEVDGLAKVAVIKHGYTRFRVTLHCFVCKPLARNPRPQPRAAVDSRWVSVAELENYAFPAANQKLLEILGGDPALGSGA
jgi:A/G-specific adenine glycosylase